MPAEEKLFLVVLTAQLADARQQAHVVEQVMGKMSSRTQRQVAELFLLLVIALHLVICPYNKVEESFNIQVGQLN